MKASVEKDLRPARERTVAQEFVSPEVNIFETKDGYVLEAEMPGVSKDGLEVTLEGNELTIVGAATPRRSAASRSSANARTSIIGGCLNSIRRLIPVRSR